MKVGFKVLDCALDWGGPGTRSVEFEQNQILQQNHWRQNFKPRQQDLLEFIKAVSQDFCLRSSNKTRVQVKCPWKLLLKQFSQLFCILSFKQQEDNTVDLLYKFNFRNNPLSGFPKLLIHNSFQWDIMQITASDCYLSLMTWKPVICWMIWMKPTLAFGVALIVHMQSTACPGFVFPSCSTWLERTIPSAPESSNWQSREKIHLAVKCNMILI